ncbi:alpha/beta-hydrolase, partial [Backusella circina FSU 941]
MNRVRLALNKLPPITSIKILRKVFGLPTPAARLILDDITKPRPCHKPWIHKVRWNGEWSGCWIGENVRKLDEASLLKRVNDCDVVFFNVHGGGFRVGSSTMYMDTYIGWIKLLRQNYGMDVMIMSVDYRLAPEHKYPAPVEDSVRAYEYLVKTISIDPEKVVVVGDCAGASLLLEMLFITHDPSMFEIVTDDKNETPQGPVLSELPRPAGAVFISPIVTDETTSESWKINTKFDFISQYTAKVIKRDYFEPLPPDAPPDSNQVLGISKLETGFRAFLPEQVLMFVGNKEVLRDDSLDLAMKAEQDGVLWETIVEDCVHDWFCIRECVKDKKILSRADVTFADFCYRSVRQIRRRSSTLPVSRNGSVRILYESSRNSDYSSTARSSEGLEIVLEEDEYEDDLSDTELNEYVADKVSKRKATKTVFV